MIRGILITGFVALCASGAAQAAQPIVISAGEHGGFSRVVVSGGASGVYVDRAARTVDIQFSAKDVALDLADINEKQKAYRVVSARKLQGPEGASLQLRISCDCSIETAQRANGKLIIDIAGDRSVSGDHNHAQVSETTPANDGVDVENARNRMRDLLQQAADEGLITMRSAAPEPKEQPRATVPLAANAELARSDSLAAPPQIPAAPCLPDSEFSVPGGKFDDDPLGAIADFRKQLEEASDQERAGVAMAFAKGYLAISFGDEAAALLADIGAGDTMLAEVARVVALRPVSPSGPLMSAVNCRGTQALWQAAADRNSKAAALAADRSGDAVKALPKRLRAVIAARIAKKLVEAGAWNDAEAFYRIAKNGEEFVTDDLQYIYARIIEHRGQGEEAEQILRGVASENSESSEDALLALARKYSDDGRAAPEELVNELGALALTGRGSREGGEAALREATVWADEGNIQAAVFLLQSAAESGASGNTAETARRIIAEAFVSADAATRLAALSAYLENRNFLEADGARRGLRGGAAEVAMEVGLPNLTAKLDAAGERSQKPASALLGARAALAAGDPETALIIAAPHADEAAFATIVVDANLALDRNYAALAAASAYPEGGDKAEITARAAWRARDWASAARAYRKIDPQSMSEDAALRYAVSAYMSGERDLPPAAKAVLARDNSAMLNRLAGLFAPKADGTIIERGKSLVEESVADIELIRELLDHG